MSGRASHVATPMLVEGFAAAVERMRAIGLAEAAGFHALFEALAWAGTIGERLKQEHKPIPATVNGLWYVRNLALHQGADVVWRITAYGAGAYGAGPFGGVGFGGGIGGATSHEFPPRSELPAPLSLRGSSDYDALIAGEHVSLVLERAVNEARGAQGS
jgi:hypothetical protein